MGIVMLNSNHLHTMRNPKGFKIVVVFWGFMN